MQLITKYNIGEFVLVQELTGCSHTGFIYRVEAIARKGQEQVNRYYVTSCGHPIREDEIVAVVDNPL